VDALLAGADMGDDSPDEAVEASQQESDRKSVTASLGRSESEAHAILASLCRKAVVERDEGVRIIWNALDLFPLSSGYNMEIQGRRYVSLESIGNSHLVVGRTE